MDTIVRLSVPADALAAAEAAWAQIRARGRARRGSSDSDGMRA
jgi:hypothetical protein